ncbi:hypothetical protein ACOSQ2_017254 [Xanthoceras sorbifolium]
MANSGNSSTLRVKHQSSQSAATSEFNSIAKTLNLYLPVKLDRDNYIHWKAQVLPAIQAYELDEFISGLQSIPPQFIEVSSTAGVIERVENKQYKQWRKSNKLLLCWLYSTVHPSIVGEITNCVTSYEVWHVLENLFAQQSMAKVLTLKEELQNITKGSMKISDFVLKVKSLGDGLKAEMEDLQMADEVVAIEEGAEVDTTTMVDQLVKSVEKEVTQQCFATIGLTELMLRIIRIILLIILIPSSSNRLLSIKEEIHYFFKDPMPLSFRHM